MMIEEMIPKLIRAGFENDMKTFESVALTITRKLKKEYPELSKEIANSIAYKNIGSSALRAIGVQPTPVDKETRYSLARTEEPDEVLEPVLDEVTMQHLMRFIKERHMSDKLIAEGVNPPTSLLFYGPPGVGKTYIAKWLSYKLNMTLITLDLASSISSYLGRTGQNVKSLLDYARSFDSILFLDEFDAIAKRRDDQSDLGELKRIVNVLLKELETWPANCIVIAATNHPELLDKAIWRRFDRVMEIKVPDLTERKLLLERHLSNFNTDLDILIEELAQYMENISPADICKYCEHVKRRYIIDKEEPKFIMVSELSKIRSIVTSKEKSKLCMLLKKCMPNIPVREISNITGFPPTTVQRYLKTGGHLNGKEK